MSCHHIAEPISPEADAKVTSLHLDLSDANAITAASSELVKTFGSIDILVNNAGILYNKKIHDMSLEEWRFGGQVQPRSKKVQVTHTARGGSGRRWVAGVLPVSRRSVYYRPCR
jgi:hypothetical protein